MADSLIVADSIQLLGGVASDNPLCAGAVFRLTRDWDLGAPQPTADMIANMVLDGERPSGHRASNRLISLQVCITTQVQGTAGRQVLAAARELLMQVIDREDWPMTWCRDGGLPMILDCKRANATVVSYSILRDKQLVSDLALSIPALPYGRSDVPVTVSFPSPLTGTAAPPSPVIIDNFPVVPGNFLSGQNAGFEGGIGNWAQNGGCTLAGTGAQFHSGAASLLMTATGTNDMLARPASPLSSNLLPVVPGQGVTASGWFRAATVARGCAMSVAWLTAALTTISTTFGAPSNNTTTSQTQRVSNFAAPAGAAWALVGVQVKAPAGAGEQHYVDDVSIGYQWTSSLLGPGPASAHWNPGLSPMSNPTGDGLAAVYTNTGLGPFDLTGQAAVTLFAGFGSSAYFAYWCRAGGPVVFSLTLTDGTNTLACSVTRQVKGSNSSSAPLFTKVRIPIPQNTGALNIAAVTGYTLKVTNRGGGSLRYTELYVDSLTAVPSATSQISPQRGWVYDLAGIQGTVRAPASWQFQQAGAPVLVTEVLSTAGSFNWVAPPGVSLISKVECWGAGGGATMGAGAGGGGEYASESNVAVTPGLPYPYTVSKGGQAGGTSDGAPGGLTSFAGNSVTVLAHGGLGGVYATRAGGAGGSGSANTVHFNGGAGGTMTAGSVEGGPGGGGSGGTASAGNAGAANSGGTGGAGGPAVTGGGAGGHGSNYNTAGGTASTGLFPGGGGGAAGQSATGATGGSGVRGQVKLTYLAPPTSPVLIAHRPSRDAPETLSPFVALDPLDVPDGTTEYPVPSLVPSLNARFKGTYTPVIVASSWNNPTAPRTITVTFRQYEQASGTMLAKAVAVTVTPTGQITNGLVQLPNITLPAKALPPDNTAAQFAITVTDTNTADRFLDVLLLDTMGETVAISSTVPYLNYYLDEPTPDVDVGLTLGSLADRSMAVSVLDQLLSISGGPLSVDPSGNQELFVYSPDGAPNALMIHFPRWRVDRTA